ncbi:hypothetical protein ACDN41_11900 [Priestia aryabhattai]|uniref:hypothetical protein n=1 Tax=Priestia aryabhattai TaxID=412384 RepID=UPI003531F68F
MDKVRVQKHAEVIETLLKRDIDSNNQVLNYNEFHALNYLLLELSKGDYYKQEYSLKP